MVSLAAYPKLLSIIGVYSEEKVQQTLDAMKARRDNLIEVSVCGETPKKQKSYHLACDG